MSRLLPIDFKLKRRLWKWWNVSAEYSWNALFKSCTSLSSSPCHSARRTLILPRSVLHTQSLPSPLTLCVWPAVPFTLIKTTDAAALPPTPAPFAHTPLPSALITEPSLTYWLVWSHPLNNPLPLLLSQPSTRSLPERPRPSPLTGGRSSSTTTPLQRGKEEDKGNIHIYSASSSTSIVKSY